MMCSLQLAPEAWRFLFLGMLKRLQPLTSGLFPTKFSEAAVSISTVSTDINPSHTASTSAFRPVIKPVSSVSAYSIPDPTTPVGTSLSVIATSNHWERCSKGEHEPDTLTWSAQNVRLPIQYSIIQIQSVMSSQSSSFRLQLQLMSKISFLFSNACPKTWTPVLDGKVDNHLVKHLPFFNQARFKVMNITNAGAIHPLFSMLQMWQLTSVRPHGCWEAITAAVWSWVSL